MTPAPWNVSTTGKFVLSTNLRIAFVSFALELLIPASKTGNAAFLIASITSLISCSLRTPKLGFWHSAIAFDSTGAEITSCGILIKLAPFLPDVAVLIALVITSDKDSGSCTSSLYFVEYFNKAALSILWCVKRNKSLRLTCPPKANTGSPSDVAVNSPVVKLLTPGPLVTSATPGLPVSRPIPWAIIAAFCSWRVTISSGPSSSSALNK